MADVAISTEGLVERYGRNRGLARLDRTAGRRRHVGLQPPRRGRVGAGAEAQRPGSSARWQAAHTPEIA